MPNFPTFLPKQVVIDDGKQQLEEYTKGFKPLGHSYELEDLRKHAESYPPLGDNLPDLQPGTSGAIGPYATTPKPSPVDDLRAYADQFPPLGADDISPFLPTQGEGAGAAPASAPKPDQDIPLMGAANDIGPTSYQGPPADVWGALPSLMQPPEPAPYRPSRLPLPTAATPATEGLQALRQSMIQPPIPEPVPEPSGLTPWQKDQEAYARSIKPEPKPFYAGALDAAGKALEGYSENIATPFAMAVSTPRPIPGTNINVPGLPQPGQTFTSDVLGLGFEAAKKRAAERLASMPPEMQAYAQMAYDPLNTAGVSDLPFKAAGLVGKGAIAVAKPAVKAGIAGAREAIPAATRAYEAARPGMEALGRTLADETGAVRFGGEAAPAKRYYHGTGSAFDVPEPAKFDQNGLYGPGYYLTDAPEVAGSYANQRAHAGDWEGARESIQSQINFAKERKTHLGITPEKQANLDRAIELLEQQKSNLGPTGAQVRAIDVPEGLRLLDVDAPATPQLVSLVDHQAASGGFPDPFAAMPGSTRPTNPTGHDVWNALNRMAADRDEANRILQAAGFDGIRYQGGKRIPMIDAAGNPIEHEALVIFPESLPKIRNAVSGLPMGSAPEIGAGLVGAATGYDPNKPLEENLPEMAKRGVLGAAGMRVARTGKLGLSVEDVSKGINRLTANAADLAADYKARGMDKRRAWDQYIIDKAIKPDMDAKDFYRVYDQVTAQAIATPKTAPGQPTHIIRYGSGNERRVQIVEDTPTLVRWVDEFGSTGSDPKMAEGHIKSIEPIALAEPPIPEPVATPAPPTSIERDAARGAFQDKWARAYGDMPETAPFVKPERPPVPEAQELTMAEARKVAKMSDAELAEYNAKQFSEGANAVSDDELRQAIAFQRQKYDTLHASDPDIPAADDAPIVKTLESIMETRLMVQAPKLDAPSLYETLSRNNAKIEQLPEVQEAIKESANAVPTPPTTRLVRDPETGGMVEIPTEFERPARKATRLPELNPALTAPEPIKEGPGSLAQDALFGAEQPGGRPEFQAKPIEGGPAVNKAEARALGFEPEAGPAPTQGKQLPLPGRQGPRPTMEERLAKWQAEHPGEALPPGGLPPEQPPTGMGIGPEGQPSGRKPGGPERAKPLKATDPLEQLEDSLKPEIKPFGTVVDEKFNGFMRAMYDRNFDIGWLEKNTGIPAHKLAQLVSGATAAGEDRIRRFALPVVEPLGKDVKHLEEYMVLQRSKDLLAFNKDANLPGNLAGWQDVIAAEKRLRATLGPDRFNAIKPAAEKLTGTPGQNNGVFYEQILKPLLDNGLLSKEALQAMRSKHPHYIDFHRADFSLVDGIENVLRRPEASVADIGIKRMDDAGSARKLDQPLARSMAQIIRTQNLISRNKAAHALVTALDEAQTKGLLPKDSVRRLTATEAAEHSNVTDTISYLVNGKKVTYQVPPVYAQIGKGLEAETAQAYQGVLAALSAPLRMGAVTYDPIFVVANPIRDSWSAFFREGLVPFSPEYVRGWVAAITQNADFSDAAEAGVLMSGIVDTMRSTEAVTRASRLGAITVQSPKDALLLIPRLIERANLTAEQATRISTYHKLRGQDISRIEAAVRARDVTVDFAKSGNVMKVINQIIPFSNAGVQGASNTLRLLKDNPKQALLASTALATPAILAYAWNQRYETAKQIPEYEYVNNYVIQIGEGVKNPDPKSPNAKAEKFPIYVKIPKGPTGAAVTLPAELAMRLAWAKDDRSIVERLLQGAGTSAGLLSPIGTGVSGLLPPVLGTGVEMATNKDIFRNRDIVPLGEQRIPPEMQYGGETSSLAVAVGEKFKVSPRMIDFAIKDYTAGVGQQSLWLSDLGLGALGYDPEARGAVKVRTLTGPEQTAKIPGIGRFYGTQNTQQGRMDWEKFNTVVTETQREFMALPEVRRLGLTLGPVGDTITLAPNVRIQLELPERAALQQNTARTLVGLASDLASRPGYKQLPDAAKRKAMDSVLDKGRDAARKSFLQQFTHEELRQRVTEAFPIAVGQ